MWRNGWVSFPSVVLSLIEALGYSSSLGKDFSLEGTIERSRSDMSSQIQNYRLVTLNDRVVPGFAGIMRESVREKHSLSDRELKVVVASSSHVSEGKAIKFAKKVTKHIRISRGWSFVSASVQPMEIGNLPLLGTPQQTDRRLTAWIVE
jgi:hypothetical protein